VRAGPHTGEWHPAGDRWHTGFVDALGTGGLLGGVEGCINRLLGRVEGCTGGLLGEVEGRINRLLGRVEGCTGGLLGRVEGRTNGLLGQVEGRSGADVLTWLATIPLTWRKSIRRVAVDRSAAHRTAVRKWLPQY